MPPLGFRQWRDTFTGLAFFPALTLLPFVRSKVGFNLFQLGGVFTMTVLLLIFNSIGNFHVALPLVGGFGAREQSDALKYFAFVFLGVSLWERHKRWKGLLRGDRWHNYSHGVSWLEFLPLRQDLIYRIADPAAAWLCGACLRKLGINGLGLWIEFAAGCLYLVENYAHEKALERDLSMLDSLLESDITSATVSHFEGQGEGQAKARSLRETGGIATGADAGLEAQIAKRRKEAAARLDDDGNLAGVRA
jgi:hypothetical protein